MSKNEAIVAKVVDDYTIVINMGRINGVSEGQRFLIYNLGEEIKDPGTGENLGKLEIIKGTGKVVHLQDKIATIKSDMKTSPKRIIRKPGRFSSFASYYAAIGAFGEEQEEYLPSETVPFDNVLIGDIARLI